MIKPLKIRISKGQCYRSKFKDNWFWRNVLNKHAQTYDIKHYHYYLLTLDIIQPDVYSGNSPETLEISTEVAF